MSENKDNNILTWCGDCAVTQQSLNIFFLCLINQEIHIINRKWGGTNHHGIVKVGSTRCIMFIVVGALKSLGISLREEITSSHWKKHPLQNGEGSGATLGMQIKWSPSLEKRKYIRHLGYEGLRERVNWLWLRTLRWEVGGAWGFCG